MKFLMVTQAGAADGDIAEQDTLIQADMISTALNELGHTCERFETSLNLQPLLETLQSKRDYVVFNLVESLGGRDCLMHLAPDVYEALGIPYTGARAHTIKRTNQKGAAKKELLLAGLPTAPWLECSLTGIVHSFGTIHPGRYILKAATEHASIGMTDDAVIHVDSREELAARLREFAQKLKLPCMAELYIDGREFNLSMLDARSNPSAISVDEEFCCDVFPPAEIDFTGLPADKPRIVGYNAKWVEDSIEYNATPRTFQFSSNDENLLAQLIDISKRTWKLFGGTGYARLDFRVSSDGVPYILEFNANPCITTYGGFTAAAEQAGLSYNAAIERIVNAAC